MPASRSSPRPPPLCPEDFSFSPFRWVFGLILFATIFYPGDNVGIYSNKIEPRGVLVSTRVIRVASVFSIIASFSLRNLFFPRRPVVGQEGSPAPPLPPVNHLMTCSRSDPDGACCFLCPSFVTGLLGAPPPHVRYKYMEYKEYKYISHRSTLEIKKKSFLGLQKCFISYAPPGRRSDVPSIVQL